MMKLVTLAFLGLCLFGVNVESADECQTAAASLTIRHFLNLDKFLGTWYTQKLGLANLQDVYVPTYKCLSVNFAANPGAGNNSLKAVESYLDAELNEATNTADVVVNNLMAPATWTVYSVDAGSNATEKTESVIFQSNHESYAIQYGCQILPDGRKRESATILTRSRLIGNRLTRILDSLLVGLGFPEHLTISMDQSGCDQ